MTTNNGLYKFSINKTNDLINLKSFNIIDGLNTNQFNYKSALLTSNKNQIYLGTLNGLLSIDPSSFQQKQLDIHTYFTDFKISGQSESRNLKLDEGVNNILYSKHITLSSEESSFSIEFAALNYNADNQIVYAYQTNESAPWVNIENNRRVNFSNLKPGTYRFVVKSGTNYNNLNSVSEPLIITIKPPFHKSGYAYFSYVLLSILGISVFFKLFKNWADIKNRIKNETFEKEIQKEIYLSKIQFFTEITHEIKTPLTLIKGPLDELKKLDFSSPKYLQNIQRISNNTDRLITLVSQLLDFRGIEKEEFRLNFIRLNIVELLRENFDFFEDLSVEKSLNYNLITDESFFEVYADREAINKILSNLIENALKYSHSKVSISFEALLSETYFRIKISNDGEVVPANHRQLIFEPFFRSTQHKTIYGTGIGLAIVNSLTQLHEGKLTYSDENGLNNFILELPKHHRIEFGKRANEILMSRDFDATNLKELPKILIVDDNSEILSFVSSLLIDDYSVAEATNVNDALKLMLEEHISLIISDIKMPDISGIEFCEQVKNDLNTSHIPVILLTAEGTQRLKMQGFESGADAYIEKPFSTVNLLSQIKSLLENRDRVKTYYANTPNSELKSIAFNKTDQEFLEKVNKVIQDNLANNLLSVDFVAAELFMSRATFYRKIKETSNLSPNELILISRLKRAAEMLSENKYKIYEIALKTGFASPAQFTKSFAKQFNCSPSKYVQGIYQFD